MSEAATNGADPEYRLNESQVSVEMQSGCIYGRQKIPRLLSLMDVTVGASILDVGCGIGAIVDGLCEVGFKAQGIEPGGRSKTTVCDLVLPLHAADFLEQFPEKKFDVVMSFGVIEHVGTINGHSHLAPNYQSVRDAFYADCLDLLKPGGILVIFAPNRLFPFDFRHGPALYGGLAVVKKILPFLGRLTIPWHRKNFLVSWSDVNKACKSLAQQKGITLQTFYFKQNGLVVGGRIGNQHVLRLFLAYTKIADMLPQFLAKFFHTETVFVARKC